MLLLTSSYPIFLIVPIFINILKNLIVLERSKSAITLGLRGSSIFSVFLTLSESAKLPTLLNFLILVESDKLSLR